MANKVQRTISLSASLWAQIDDLIDYYGDGPAEILTQVLNEWFSDNQRAISDRKARIDSLRPKIEGLQQQAEQQSKKRRRQDLK